MEKPKTNTDLTLLTAKNVANILNVSLWKAKQVIKDVKIEFGIKTKITRSALDEYFHPHRWHK